ncbi:MAG: hypothetical protein E7279_08645 [Lachnospiraceae bacterium]|nr:hypothetical protein [Lachnospiraceae bacterium]
MTYQDFESKIIELIDTELSDECTIDTKPVIKNNGITLHGLVINNGKCNISPTIYLDYYYKDFENGADINKLAKQVVAQYKKFELDEDFDISIFTDYEKCKKRISYKLINYEQNKELLEDIPHIKYLDLAIVFYYLLEGGLNETSSILIRNSHMEHWEVNTDDLMAQAQNNTPRLLQSEIRSLTDVVKEILADNPMAITPEDEPMNQTMYVLTNKLKLYGACCILYKSLLEEFAEQQGCDLYIIPSSVHEVLLLPCSEELDPEYLTSLVQEVNSSELSTEDILSDHVYLYSRKNKEITY